MIHIRQKNINPYTIVVTDGWDKPLDEFPCLIEHPELFEIADCDIPENVQYLIYNNN